MLKVSLKNFLKWPTSVFYGWWIVVISIVVDALKHGAVNVGFTVFFLPVQRELGISRTAYSLTDTLGRLVGGIQGPVVGYLTDRLGPAAMMVAGGVLVGVGFILLYFTHSYLHFLLVFVAVIFLGSRTGYNNASTTAVNQWFRRKRSLAMSTLSIGNGLGGAAFGPLIGLMVLTLGWRPTALIFGIVILAVVPPLSLLVRRSPETMGLQPDGDPLESPGQVGPRQRDRGTPGEVPSLAAPLQNTGARTPTSQESWGGDFTAKEAMRTPTYWRFVLAVGLRNTVHSGVRGPHLVPMMVWAGVSEPIAAVFVGVMSFVTLFNPLVGWMGDKWSKQKISAFAMIAGALALLMLLRSSGHLWQLAFFAILLGLSETANPLAWAIMGDFFGRTSYATLRGWQHLPDQLMSMWTPVWVGLVFDYSGSYYWALIPLIILYALSAFFHWTIPKPKAPARLQTRQGTAAG